MIARNIGGAILGLMLVLTASACDDNPLADDRDQAAYFRLNPVSVAVNAGGDVIVDAVVVNQYGAATNAAVTGTPCDNKIVAVPDTSRTAYEFPERFRVTGATLGISCLIVRGGGLTDTVEVRVVPASIQIAGVDTLLSGNTSNLTVRFLNTAGQPVTGLSVADVTLSSASAAIASVTAAGAVTAFAPGTTTLTATLLPKFGVTRSGTGTVNVKAGSFAGTIAQSSAAGGQYLTLTQGALTFDADTEIRVQVPTGFFAGITPSIVSRATGTTISVMLPPGLAAGSVLRYDIVNVGASQVALTGQFTTTAATPYPDTWGTAPNAPATAPTFTVFNDVFGTLPGIDQQAEAYFCFTAARTGSHTMTVHWDDGSDIDAYITNAAGTSALLARETLANPETGAVNLTSGTKYCVNVFMWESAVPNREVPFRIRVQ